MFRKLLYGSIVGAGLLAPLAATPALQAHEHGRSHGRVHGRYEHGYRVFYHDPCRPGWVMGGSFASRREAEIFAATCRSRGWGVDFRF